MVSYRIDFVGFVVILRIPRESFEGRWPYLEDPKRKIRLSRLAWIIRSLIIPVRSCLGLTIVSRFRIAEDRFVIPSYTASRL